MNSPTQLSQPATCNVQPATLGSAAVPEISEIIPAELADALPKKRKKRDQHKIAKLPQEQQNMINHMLDDGKSYEFIAAEMAKLGVSLNGENISNWFNGPYQQYVRDCEWREDLLMLSQSTSALDGLPLGQRFQESLVQLAFVDIFRALKDPETRADRLNHIRLFNALARLNREALNVRKYNDLRADRAAALLSVAPGTPSVEQAQHGIFCAFDHAMSLKPAPGPIGPDLNIYLGLEPPPDSASASTLAAPKSDVGGSSSSSSSKPAASNQPASADNVDLSSEPVPSVPSVQSIAPSTPDARYPSNPASNIQNPTSAEPGTRDVQLAISAPEPSITQSVADQSEIENQKSKMKPLPEKCHECHAVLPPLLSTGERPNTHCLNCGAGLCDPSERYLYCPACQGSLRKIFNGANRTSDDCLHCAITLPPPPPGSTLSHTLLAAPNPASAGEGTSASPIQQSNNPSIHPAPPRPRRLTDSDLTHLTPMTFHATCRAEAPSEGGSQLSC